MTRDPDTADQAKLFENLTLAMDYRQCARALSVSTSLLTKLVMRREIPHVKIGRSVRFIPEEVAAWLKERSTTRAKKRK